MSLKRNQKLDLSNDSFYKGNTKDGIPHGKGELSTPFSILTGKWKEGNIKGKLKVNINNIFFIGGDLPSNEKRPFTTFSFLTENWNIKSLPPCYYARSVGKLVFNDHYFYYIGGFNGTRAVPYVERYDILHSKWENICPLINRRASFSSFTYNSDIYVCGGVMAFTSHDSIEKYDKKENKWKSFGNLSYGRSSLISHVWKDKLYILGGINLKDTPPYLEIFDLKTKEKSLDENIIVDLFSTGSTLIEINDKPYIFIAGGKKHIKESIEDKVYSYSIEENTLNEISPLNIGRLYSSLVVFQNELYCIGGHDKKMNYKLPYEKYNFLENKWETKKVINLSMSGSSFFPVENQKITLEGKWKDGELNGPTTIFINDKKIEGKYKKGKKEGFFNDIYYRNDIPVSYHEVLWEIRVNKIRNIPDNFKCPISLEIMKEPVIIESGITFDKKNIQEWFLHHNTCPFTRNIVNKKCIPNKILKTMIYELIEKKIRN